MPDLRYVCMSDLHLGEEDSLFTNVKGRKCEIDPLAASPVMTGAVRCLRSLIPARGRKPTLILSGDILELALARTHEAAMVFERLMELLMPAGGDRLFERVIYIPGNHDHHLWELARETQYVKHKIDTNRSDVLEEPYHNTRMFDPRPLASFFLTRLVKTSSRISDFNVETAYPNYGVMTRDGAKCIMIHHGHFIESIYQLMTTVMGFLFPERQEPKTVWEIERENWAWIDFFWSALGRSGPVGEEIEIVYEKMRDPEGLTDIVVGFLRGLMRGKTLYGSLKWSLTEPVLRRVIPGLIRSMMQRERAAVVQPLGKKGKEGLKKYVGGPLKQQIHEEHKHVQGKIPYDVTFVFGHTHKPFEGRVRIDGYAKQVKLYNTGGWVVDSVEPQPIHGGAIVLVDEDFNVASLRMYNEEAAGSEYRVEIKSCGKTRNPLLDELKTTIEASRDPWKSFSATAAREVARRAKALGLRRKKRS